MQSLIFGYITQLLYALVYAHETTAKHFLCIIRGDQMHA